MKKIKHLCLYVLMCSVLYSPTANALGKKTPSSGSSSTQVSSSMQDFLLNLGIFYAKTNPQIAPVLLALGINNASDLKKFLNGDASGSNVQDIVTNAALQYAFQNPKYQAVFQQLGVTDFASLKALLTSGNGANTDLLLNMAFNYMNSNPNYSNWLTQLGISDPSDLQAILSGTGDKTDLKAIILNFAMIYAQSNPQYGPYIMLISALLGNGSSSVNLSDPFLGAFEGLSTAEIKRIQSAKKIKL